MTATDDIDNDCPYGHAVNCDDCHDCDEDHTPYEPGPWITD